MVFWASLGLILGALGAFLGALLVFLRAFGSTLHAQNFFLDSLPGQIYCSFSYLLSLPSSKPLFSSSWSLFVSILNSQTDAPTLQNVDLLKGILTFLKNQHFRSKDGFKNVLGLSRAPFGSSWGSLGALWGLYIDHRGLPDSSWISFGHHLLASCCGRWS